MERRPWWCVGSPLTLLLTGVWLLLCIGCSIDETVSSDQWTWLWAAVPLFIFGVPGTGIVSYRRKAQIKAWDLRSSPNEPSVKGIFFGTLAVAGGFVLLFTTYNLLLDMDGGQKGLNIGLWALGTVLGTTVALYFGLQRANPRPLSAPKGRR